MNALNMSSPSSNLSFKDAHNFCKGHMSLNEACSAITETRKQKENVVCQVKTPSLEDSAHGTEGREDEEGHSVTHKISSAPVSESGSKRSNMELKKKKLWPCGRCGGNHRNNDCPHLNTSCNKCHKIGHLAAFCRGSSTARTQAVHAVATPTTSNRKFIRVKLNRTSVRLQLDTASDVSIISKGLWKKIGGPRLAPTTFAARHAGAGPLVILGEASLDVRVKG